MNSYNHDNIWKLFSKQIGTDSVPPQEEDWKVLELTLSAIKKRLCNAQFHTRRNLDSLTEQLVEMLNNTKRLEELKNTPKDFHASEVRLRIYPVG